MFWGSSTQQQQQQQQEQMLQERALQLEQEFEMGQLQEASMQNVFKCFEDCIVSFTSTALSQKETDCVQGCLKRGQMAFMRMNARSNQLFQEQMQQEMAQQNKK